MSGKLTNVLVILGLLVADVFTPFLPLPELILLVAIVTDSEKFIKKMAHWLTNIANNRVMWEK